MPGGGYANLDLLERLALSPDVTVATILGEGSFHQFHGGTTTNVADEAERRARITAYRQHFRELRGRDLIGLDRPMKFVGSLEARASRRTRPRVATGFNFDALRDPVAYAPDTPVPLPDELKLAAIAGVWEHRAWREATWLGHPVNRYPADLHTYQELLVARRPALVVATGDDDGLGGRALFLASVCDQLGHGRVVAVGRGAGEHLGTHPRLTYVDGDVAAPEVAEQVRALAPDAPDAMVLLAVGDLGRTKRAFALYAPLVPVDGYLVVENTVVNGRPVAPDFGAGPQDAVFQLLAEHHDFVIDPTGERYTVTFNRNGYLRRTAS
jgi:cephalosporin hydroxylase